MLKQCSKCYSLQHIRLIWKQPLGYQGRSNDGIRNT
jgi:hypothetical protein